jgi:hypothetical protein
MSWSSLAPSSLPQTGLFAEPPIGTRPCHVAAECDAVASIGHRRPSGPARASTAGGRAQQAEPDRTGRRDALHPGHVRAAAGGVLIP